MSSLYRGQGNRLAELGAVFRYGLRAGQFGIDHGRKTRNSAQYVEA